MAYVRPIAQVIILLATLAAIAIGGINYLIRTKVDPTLVDHRSRQERFFDDYRKDQKVLQSYEFFRSTHRGQSNAGPFLNPRIYWTPRAPRMPSSITIPQQITEKVLRYEGDWIRHYQLFQNAGLDYSIFDELRKYDYWSLEILSPINELNETDEFVAPEDLPIPQAMDLIILAKLRLMEGVRSRQPKAAIEDVHHLARLMLTTENLNLQIGALSILLAEREAVAYYLENGLMKPADWVLIPEEVINRAHRTLWATRDYLHVWTSPGLMKEIFLTGSLPFGFCSALNEAIPVAFAYRPLLENKWPLERNFRENFEVLRQIVDVGRRSCRIQYLTELLSAERLTTELRLPTFFASLPYARRLFGLQLSMLTFHGFDEYTRL